MILLLSGTGDGIEIIKLLNKNGLDFIVSSTTPYGTRLAEEAGAKKTITDKLDTTSLIDLIESKKIEAIIDATHPYAMEISKNAINAGAKTGIRYIRYQRPETIFPISDNIHFANGFEEAGKIAAKYGKRIFYTGGSNNLEEFLRNCKSERITVRVLPIPGIIEKCIELDIKIEDIIAIKGPFSESMNLEMFREYRSDMLVTKDSGQLGGTNEKVLAALNNGMKIVIIKRPFLDFPRVTTDYGEILSSLSEN